MRKENDQLSLNGTINLLGCCLDHDNCQDCKYRDEEKIRIRCEETMRESALHHLLLYKKMLLETIREDDEETQAKTNEEHNKQLGKLPVWWPVVINKEGHKCCFNTDHIKYIVYGNGKTLLRLDEETEVLQGDVFGLNDE